MNALFVKSLYKIAKVIGVIYRSQSQNIIEFENFISNFEKLLNYTTSSNDLFTIILGNFNARPSVSWTKDKTTTGSTQLESLTSVHGFYQLISQPTIYYLNLYLALA